MTSINFPPSYARFNHYSLSSLSFYKFSLNMWTACFYSLSIFLFAKLGNCYFSWMAGLSSLQSVYHEIARKFDATFKNCFSTSVYRTNAITLFYSTRNDSSNRFCLATVILIGFISKRKFRFSRRTIHLIKSKWWNFQLNNNLIYAISNWFI